MDTGHILILEDERDWQDRHRLYLQDHGYTVKVVNTAAAAITAVQTDGNELIRYVVLDQVLMDPELKAAGIPSLSSITGVDVLKTLREMPRKHPLRFAMITESSMKKATQSMANPAKSVELFVVEHEALQRKVGKDTLLLAKHRFEDPLQRDEAYRELVQYFATQPMGTNVVVMPTRRLLVGLGFEETALDELLTRARFPREDIKAILNNRRVLPLADFVARLDTTDSADELPDLCVKTLNRLLSSKDKKEIATWQPGDGHIPKSDWIVARGVAVQIGTAREPEPVWEEVPVWGTLPPAEMQILDVIGFNAEMSLVTGRPASRVFDPQFYNGTDLAPKEEELGLLAEQIGAAQERKVQAKAFLSGGGGEGALPGVQVNARGRSPHAQRVSKTIALLRKKLGDRKADEEMKEFRLGLGPRELVMQYSEQTAVYHTGFDTRLVFYTHKSRNKGGRPKSATPKKSR